MAKFSSELSGIFHSDIQEYEYPSGVISDEGWVEIEQYLFDNINTWPLVDGFTPNYRHDRAYMRPVVGDNSVVTGNTKAPDGPRYVGSFAKRASKYIHQECHRNAPKEAISQIGNIFAKHSTGGGLYYIDFTNKINWCDGDFGDGGSCFWGCRKNAKDLLEDQPGFHAVRLYRQNPYDEGFRGIGRAWILPHPDDSNAFVIFNAYGPMTTIGIARLLSHRHGLAYTHCKRVYNNNTCDGLLFINNCSGTVIGTPDTLKEVGLGGENNRTIDFGIDESDYDNSVRCESCECVLDQDDTYSTPTGETMCSDCFYESYCFCRRCSDSLYNEDAVVWQDETFCAHCIERMGVVRCEVCEELSDSCLDIEGTIVCEICFHDTCFQCTECDDDGLRDNAVEIENELYCEYCANLVGRECADCGDKFLTENMTEVENNVYCPDCIPEPVFLNILDNSPENKQWSPASAEGQLNLF